VTGTFTKDNLPAVDGEPGWARSLRGDAVAAFEALPMPSQSTEEWRYTDVSGLDLGIYRPPAPAAAGPTEDGSPVRDIVDGLGERAGVLAHLDGVRSFRTATDELAAKGVIFTSLDQAIAEHPDLVEKRLHALVPYDRTRFTALHAAFRTGGTFLYVPRNVAVELPLQAITYLEVDRAAVFPHTLVVAEEGAEVTFIDRFVSPDLTAAFSDAVTELHLGPGAQVDYVSLQDWGRGVTHLAVQRANVDRDASLRTLSVAFGASLSRTEVEAVLAAPGARSEMLGVYFTDGEEHYDHRTLQDHAAPHGTSDLLYKGALRDRSRAVYSGWIKVRPGAQKTDAMQTNRNIVLSEGSRADSIPNLEIEADDVKCGHAASVGPVSEDELFYLQSRGIPREEAERLIVKGFFQEVLDRIPLEEVRDAVDAAIDDELRGA
jgi:Fe-S cluster assembly protein SufD